MLICFVVSSILKTSNSKCSEKHYIGYLGDEYLQQYSFFDSIFFHSSTQNIYLFIGMYFIVKHTNDFEIQTQSQNFPDNPRMYSTLKSLRFSVASTTLINTSMLQSPIAHANIDQLSLTLLSFLTGQKSRHK